MRKGVIYIRHLGDITKINGAEIEPVDCITAKVYMYEFPNGKIYIGMTTKRIEERRDCGYNHNQPLKAAMREYGWKAITKSILAEFDNTEDAFAEEERQIELHDATNPLVGYNISKGGKKDPKKTAEDLRKAVWYIERYIGLIEGEKK